MKEREQRIKELESIFVMHALLDLIEIQRFFLDLTRRMRLYNMKR